MVDAAKEMIEMAGTDDIVGTGISCDRRCRSGSILVLYFLIYIMIPLIIEREFLRIDRNVPKQ